MSTRHQTLLASSILAACCLTVHGADNPDQAIDPSDPAQEGNVSEEVIVVASRLPTEAAKLGQTVSLLTPATMDAIGYRYAADLFRYVPGVAVNRTGGYGGLTQLRMRGGEANHMVVLIDGIDASSESLLNDF